MYEEIVKRFGIPEAARDYVKDMFTEQEIYFVENMDKPEFTKEDIAAMIPSDPDFARSAYHRGILSLASDHEEVYRLNNFYGMLDVFAISRQEVYRSFPKEVQKALDDWYFQAYLDGLDPDLTAAPTEDRVLTLDETLQFIDEQERTPYLNFCDCRSLAGDCGMPTKTCITYRDGINTFVHRGHSQALTKEEAKDVVRQADKDGLMHTVNSNGICNCCGDCCYLFRGQRARSSAGLWPASKHIVSIDKERCVGCGKCTRRCHLQALEMENKKVRLHGERCAGCGICATACPVQALEMKDR